MSDGNILSAGINELKELKEMLIRLNDDKVKNSELTVQEDQLEKQIQMREKQLSDKIASVVKTRSAELSATYDEQLEKTKSRLKKVRAKKDKQKSFQVTERIASETAQVREERKQLYEQVGKLYKENNIPRFLNNRFMHAIYIPQGIKDILIILLTLMVVLFLLPCGIYYFAFRPNTVSLIVLYIVTVVLFGAVYMLLNHISKERSPQTFEKIKSLRRELNMNQKNIHRMEKAIRKDKDESIYDLDKFNSELKELEEELGRIAEEKKAALKKFEGETKAVIAAELTAEFAEELDPLREEHERVYGQQRRTEENIKRLSMKLTNEYNSYLGKENLEISTMDALLGIMEAGEAATVKDALAVYRVRAAQGQPAIAAATGGGSGTEETQIPEDVTDQIDEDQANKDDIDEDGINEDDINEDSIDGSGEDEGQKGL